MKYILKLSFQPGYDPGSKRLCPRFPVKRCRKGLIAWRPETVEGKTIYRDLRWGFFRVCFGFPCAKKEEDSYKTRRRLGENIETGQVNNGEFQAILLN